MREIVEIVTNLTASDEDDRLPGDVCHRQRSSDLCNTSQRVL